MRCLLVTILLSAPLLAADEFQGLHQAIAALDKALVDGHPREATAALVAIGPLYPKAEQEEQKRAVSTIGKAARSKDLRVRHGAFAALAVVRAKGSSKYLKKWLNPPKRFKGIIPPSYGEAIRAAGVIADLSTLSQLEKLMGHYELTFAVVATEALGGYHTLPTKRRKGLAFDLVDRLTRLSAKQRRKASEQVYARKATLAAATVKALQGVTGEKYTSLQGWQNWKERAEKQRDPFD